MAAIFPLILLMSLVCEVLGRRCIKTFYLNVPLLGVWVAQFKAIKSKLTINIGSFITDACQWKRPFWVQTHVFITGDTRGTPLTWDRPEHTSLITVLLRMLNTEFETEHKLTVMKKLIDCVLVCTCIKRFMRSHVQNFIVNANTWR